MRPESSAPDDGSAQHDQLRLFVHSNNGFAGGAKPTDNARTDFENHKLLSLVPPHGRGALKPLILEGEQPAAVCAQARTLRAVRVSSREEGDLIMLGIGAFTPLEGFMTSADWAGVCDSYRTVAGLFWPMMKRSK